ncbi:MAG TPA: hypothetical protein ENI96_10580 [Sedimenticola thiotaurini]|uniref:Uncharacterized protein n=1 Tax=Sedimenticola thiotaurini TaxID=1543721 RepID=A0A831W9F4_9GAMM|nr:hypothetical protein [Sedimenticola thiotaurini]
MMRAWFAFAVLVLPLLLQAGEYKSSLLVQTGEMKEHNLVVRNITDLGSNRTCLAFYVQTKGTSPVVRCYHAAEGFGASLFQVGHLKVDDLVIRKLDDTKNNMYCLVAYVSTPGTSPAVTCYPNTQRTKDNMVESGHLREGDLDIRKILDRGNNKICLVAYVRTKGTSPSVACYDSIPDGKGGLYQTASLKEGDLVVRKIEDTAAATTCLVSYVSTPGTRSFLSCDQHKP